MTKPLKLPRNLHIVYKSVKKKFQVYGCGDPWELAVDLLTLETISEHPNLVAIVQRRNRLTHEWTEAQNLVNAKRALLANREEKISELLAAGRRDFGLLDRAYH